MTLILNKDEVAKVLNMKDCINMVEAAFAELANGTADMPMRNNIKPPGGISLYMPAYLKEMKALACKVVTVYKDNPLKHDLPTTIGKVLLQDPETGDVTCIMDGGFLTAMRTGAASGVATKYLPQYLNWFIFLEKVKKSTDPVMELAKEVMSNTSAIESYRKIEKNYLDFDIPHYLKT